MEYRRGGYDVPQKLFWLLQSDNVQHDSLHDSYFCGCPILFDLILFMYLYVEMIIDIIVLFILFIALHIF